MVVALALVSALLFGIGDFCGGLASRRASLLSVLLVSHGIGLTLLGVAGTVSGGEVQVRDLLAGSAGGVLGGLGVACLYRGLATGPMAIIAPVSAVVAAALPVLAGLLLGERLSPLAICGIVVALAAVALISTGSSSGAGSGPPVQALLLGIAAGVCFALFFFMLARASGGAQLWPLVAARATTTTVFLLIGAGLAASGRQALRVGDRSAWLLIGATGLCDAVASVLFVIAVHRGLLSLVAVLSSLYPAATVLCAFAVLHERLRVSQLVGVAAALAAVVLISAG